MLRQQLEEKNGLHLTVSTPKPLTPPATLNQETAEAILETAAMLQNSERDRLSIAAVQALAAKRGIAPHHVRQALEMHGYPSATRTKLTPVRLTKTQWQVTTLTLALFWLAAIAFPFYFPATAAVIGLLPLLLAAVLGFFLRYKRASAMAGGVLTVIICSMIALGTYQRGHRISDEMPLITLVFVLALYTLPSIGGAMLRQWIAKRQLPYEPTVIRTSDLDR